MRDLIAAVVRRVAPVDGMDAARVALRAQLVGGGREVTPGGSA